MPPKPEKPKGRTILFVLAMMIIKLCNKERNSMFKKIADFLNGKKSYFGIAAGVIYSVLIALGVVESNELVWATIVGFTGVSFRLAIK